MTKAVASSASPKRIADLLGRLHDVARCAKPKIKKGTIKRKPKSR